MSVVTMEVCLAERVGFVPDEPASINNLRPVSTPQITRDAQNLSIRYKTGTPDWQPSPRPNRSWSQLQDQGPFDSILTKPDLAPHDLSSTRIESEMEIASPRRLSTNVASVPRKGGDIRGNKPDIRWIRNRSFVDTSQFTTSIAPDVSRS
jgi:hypothetical protein